MADALGLGSSVERRGGSSPSSGTELQHRGEADRKAAVSYAVRSGFDSHHHDQMKVTVKQLKRIINESAGGSNLDKAVALATKLHTGQTDKAGKDYIDHPLRVMRTVQSLGYDDDVAVAAVLHDTVEDTELTIDDVRQQFGPRVADTVALLSKNEGEQYAAFIDRIIASGNVDAMRVKLADLTDNMDVSRLGREPDEWDKKRLNRYELAFKKLTDATGG